MSRLVVISLAPTPTDAVLGTLEQYCRRGLASGSVVRCLVPSGPGWASTHHVVRASVPLEPILPAVPVLDTDSDTAVLEYLCDVPSTISGALHRARLHPDDLVVVLDADPVLLLGLAAWSSGKERTPAVVVEVADRGDIAGSDWSRLHRIAARRLTEFRPHRMLATAARPEDSERLVAFGYPIIAPGRLGGATASVAAGLLPRAPATAPEGDGARAAGRLEPHTIRRALGLPVTGRIVVVWGDGGVGAVRALAALPWAPQLTCLAVGVEMPDQAWPFTLGKLPSPHGREHLQALAAVGDLHVMPSSDADPAWVGAVMAQGRPLLCPIGSDAARHLDEGQLYPVGGLEWHLAGMLLRPDLLRLFGARNLTTSEDMQCVSAL